MAGERGVFEFDGATLARGVRSTEVLMLRFCEGFGETTKCRQTPGLSNHAAWILGHCSMTMHHAADRVLGYEEDQPLPTRDFVSADGTAGDPSRYDTATICFGSTPTGEASRFPRWARCVEVYRTGSERLAASLEETAPGRIGRSVRWGPIYLPVGDLVWRVVFHNGTHAGQLVDLRRALGFERVVG